MKSPASPSRRSEGNTLENVVPSPVVSIIEKFKHRVEPILPETSIAID